jgi:uncharacterized protein YbjT (DUF2867 family)
MIVITAPTSQIGHHVVGELLATDAPLRLIARDPSKLAESVRERVEVVQGSHGDAAVVERAFEGAEAVFWLAPPNPQQTLEQVYLDFTRPAAEAFRRLGVKRVVAVTALGRGTEWQDRAGLVTASIRMDDMIMASGAAFRGLAMPSFMDNALRQAATIKSEGAMYGPIDPDKKTPTTATQDMGAVAARLLADERWSGQHEAPVLGPEDLSMNDMAQIVSEVLGREVRYRQVTFDAFKAQLLGHGSSESFAQGYVDMMRAKNEGMDNLAERNAETRTPTTFRQWCEQSLKPAVLG